MAGTEKDTPPYTDDLDDTINNLIDNLNDSRPGDKSYDLDTSSMIDPDFGNAKDAMEDIQCGEECQNKKKAYKEYMRLREVNRRSNKEYISAQQKYLRMEMGDENFFDSLTKQYNREFDKIISVVQRRLWRGYKEIANLYMSCKTDLMSMDSYRLLFQKMHNSNDFKEKEYREIVEDVTMNDRIAYYETQGVEALNGWFRFFRWWYYFFIFVFVVAIFFLKSKFNNYATAGIVLAFIIYPFVVKYLVLSLFSMFAFVLSLIPYNTYTKDLGKKTPDPNFYKSQREKMPSYYSVNYKFPSVKPYYVVT